MRRFKKKNSKIFSPEGPRENVSSGPAVAFDGATGLVKACHVCVCWLCCPRALQDFSVYRLQPFLVKSCKPDGNLSACNLCASNLCTVLSSQVSVSAAMGCRLHIKVVLLVAYPMQMSQSSWWPAYAVLGCTSPGENVT